MELLLSAMGKIVGGVRLEGILEGLFRYVRFETFVRY